MEERFPRVDFVDFHRHRVPDLLDAHGTLAGPDVDDVAPLAIRVDADAFTYVPHHGSVRVVDGDVGAGTVVALAPEAWSEFVHELRTAFGLVIGELATFPRGEFADLVRWEPALRAIWHGRPIYDENALDAVAGLDLSRSFLPGVAPDSEMRDFLSRTGFLHVRGVFTEDEMLDVAEEVERLRREASFDDGRSWWAKNADGHDVCCRLIYAGARSELIARTAADERIVQLVDLAGVDVARVTDRLDGESVVIKNSDVVEGLSDLPWHRDCGMGGHPVLCPGVNVGIQIDAATAENGQLHFLAGSHGSSNHFPTDRDLSRLPVQAVETEPGDVTLHIGHVLHAAPPPAGQHDGRRTLYATFVPPLAFEMVDAGRGYNDSVLERRGRVAL